MRFTITAVLVASAVLGAAQEADVQREIQLTRAVIQTERQAWVAAAMNLDPEEAKAFWPLYREYRNQVEVLGDREVELITDYAEHWEEMTDAKAAQLLDEWFAIEKDELALKRKYVKRFRKILPDRKVARYFQLENKLDVAIDSEAAAQIPLVE